MRRAGSSMLADRVAQRLRDLGESQAYLVHRLNIRRDFVSDLVTGRKRSIAPAALARFAVALRCTEAYLRGEVDDPAGGAPVRPVPPSPRIPFYLSGPGLAPDPGGGIDDGEREAARENHAYLDALDPSTERDDALDPEARLNGFELRLLSRRPLLPVARRPGRPARSVKIPLFVAAPGRDFRIEEGGLDSTVGLPQELARTHGAYALVWPGDDLEPRIRRGERLYAAPGLGLRLDDDVVVVTLAPTGPNIVAGRLAVARRSHISLAPFGTGDLRLIPAAAIRVVHRIALILAAGL